MLVQKFPLSYFKTLTTKAFKRLFDEIVKATPLLNDTKYTIATRCNWYLNNIKDFPKCHKCGKQLKQNISAVGKYPKWCSASCKNSDSNFIETCRQSRYKKNNGKWHSDDYPEKVRQGSLRNGHEANWKNPDKMKATKLADYGSSSYVNPNKAKQTRLKQNNGCFCSEHELKMRSLHSKSKTSYKKGQETYFKRTGYRNPGQNPNVMKKSKAPYLFDGRYFRSSWELAKFIYHRDMGDIFDYQPSVTLTYLDQFGKEHHYQPDFIVNGQMQEVKGDQFFKDGKMTLPYRHKSWTDEKYQEVCKLYEAKHKCMIDNNIVILTRKDIQFYLGYVDVVYGKNYMKQFKKI